MILQAKKPHRAAATSLGILVLGFLLAAVIQGPAQTFTVLHSFTGGADGANPGAGVIMDAGGRLYGTASAGGTGAGTVFRMTRTGSNWTLNPLYTFTGATDGATPMAALTIGPDGGLYGTATYGGNTNDCGGSGCGVVFELRPPMTPPRTALSPWNETVLHAFTFLTDGAVPFSEVVFDAAGNLYGTTWGGGSVLGDGPPGSGEDCAYHCGVAYQLTHSNGSWELGPVYLFSEDTGSNPFAGMAFDQQGALYGALSYTGLGGYGSLFKLTHTSSGFGEVTVHSFGPHDGGDVFGTPVMDSAGNLYGGNPGYQGHYDGSIFQVSSSGQFSTIYTFSPGDGPYAGLTLDAAGDLYGTTEYGGANNDGSVFKLTHSGEGWTLTTLHDFQQSEGCAPFGKVLLDANGNLYGTTSMCGANQYGSVWEIAP